MNLLTGGEMIAFYESCKDCCKLPKLTGHRSPENPCIGSLCSIVWTRGFGVNHSIFARYEIFGSIWH